jgi:hypothetical protein
MHLNPPPQLLPRDKRVREKRHSVRSDPDQQLPRAFITKHESLASLADRAGLLIEMRILFREATPAGIAQFCQVANFRNGVVVIAAQNSAAAAKMKQLAPRLMTLYLAKGWQVNAIQVQVQ